MLFYTYQVIYTMQISAKESLINTEIVSKDCYNLNNIKKRKVHFQINTNPMTKLINCFRFYPIVKYHL